MTTLRIRARIHPSDDDRAVLTALGEHFSVLLGKDLAARCRAGKAHDKTTWAERKQALTKDCSSRWAGWVTKTSNDAYATAERNQRRELADKRAAVAAIEEKLRLPIASTAERKEAVRAERQLAGAEGRRPTHLDFGYRSGNEHAMKRRRLGVLQAHCARLERDLAAGTVHVTRGGKQLLRSRLHLEEAGLTEEPADLRAGAVHARAHLCFHSDDWVPGHGRPLAQPSDLAVEVGPLVV